MLRAHLDDHETGCRNEKGRLTRRLSGAHHLQLSAGHHRCLPLPRANAAAGLRPPVTSSSASATARRPRLRFLHALYKAAEGSTSSGVRFKELGEQLGLTEEETWIVRSYLANEGLPGPAPPSSTSSSPTKASRRWRRHWSRPPLPPNTFRPRENVILIGTADGAVIQQGNTDSGPRSRTPRATLEGGTPASGRPRGPHQGERSTGRRARRVGRRGRHRDGSIAHSPSPARGRPRDGGHGTGPARSRGLQWQSCSRGPEKLSAPPEDCWRCWDDGPQAGSRKLPGVAPHISPFAL